MTSVYIHAHVFPAAYALLPDVMRSQRATAMLLAIGWQESRFLHRQQIGGTARGFWQFEQVAVSEVLSNQKTKDHAQDVLKALAYPKVSTPFRIYDALADNDVLAAAFARLFLWRHPRPLPGCGDVAEGWRQYRETWRPGKPHESTWEQAWALGWPSVEV